jgi:hypothetical protein
MTLSGGAQGYEILRSVAADTGFIPISPANMVNKPIINTFIDRNIPSDMDGKSYYYKLVAKYDNEDIDSNVVDVPIDRKYLNCVCSVLSTNRQHNGFALGTYIPVSLEITVKRDISNLQIVLDNNLKNASFTNNLNAVLVLEVNGTATRLFKTKWSSSVYNNSSDLSKVSIPSSNIIDINASFKKNVVIHIQLALKTSAGQDVLSYGIQNYYNKQFQLNFRLQDDAGNLFGNASDSVTITKPNLK